MWTHFESESTSWWDRIRFHHWLFSMLQWLWLVNALVNEFCCKTGQTHFLESGSLTLSSQKWAPLWNGSTDFKNELANFMWIITLKVKLLSKWPHNLSKWSPGHDYANIISVVLACPKLWPDIIGIIRLGAYNAWMMRCVAFVTEGFWWEHVLF